ncbi:hypothetical protein L150_03034 [Candida albicans Ca529L]|nr:hypothetical protein L150_03034 [Candida albicans Ca529L]
MLYFFFLFGSSIFPVESNNRIYKFVCYKSIFICVFAIVTVNVVIMIFNIAVLKKKKEICTCISSYSSSSFHFIYF